MIEKDKRYLITGGTGVIGYSLCRKILNLGGQVVVMSRSKKKLIELQKGDQYPAPKIGWLAGSITTD